MNIEEFVSEDNHMCNLCGDLFYKIFDQEVIYDLPNNEFNKEIIYWLSQYLVGNLREPLDSIPLSLMLPNRYMFTRLGFL
ncbi:hypothetical protein HTZ85_08995 [Escherichia coli]|nr:hypothetical protein [Escherichia coli]